MNHIGKEEFDFAASEYDPHSPIEINGKRYIWSTNFGAPKHVYEKQFPEIYKRAVNQEKI